MGQLPVERVTPDRIFDRVGLDYAGLMLVKYSYVCKPTVTKSYICVFIYLPVKAVNLELVSNLTSEAFITNLRQFISHHGKRSLLWSDHGSNFARATQDLADLMNFLFHQQTQE